MPPATAPPPAATAPPLPRAAPPRPPPPPRAPPPAGPVISKMGTSFGKGSGITEPVLLDTPAGGNPSPVTSRVIDITRNSPPDGARYRSSEPVNCTFTLPRVVSTDIGAK